MNEGWWWSTGAKLYKRDQERKISARKHGNGWWSVVCPLVYSSLCQGHRWPKTRNSPAVVHLPRPPWHWPNLHWLIFFQALKCDLSNTFLSTTNWDLKLSFLKGVDIFNWSVMPIMYLHRYMLCICRIVCMYLSTSLSDYCLLIVLLLFHGAFAWQWESSLISKE